MGTMSSNQKMLVSFVLGLVIGGGGAWLWLERDLDGALTADPEQSTTTASGTEIALSNTGVGMVIDSMPASGPANITADDQPAGILVTVKSFTLPEVGWVVIHEERNGVLSNFIPGARRFDAGAGSGVVELVRGTVAGESYYAVLHGDDGDRQFDYQKDLPLVDQDGNMLAAKFKAL